MVDDSALMRKLLGKIFATADDFEVHFARDGVEALSMVATVAPNVVTLDIHMPQMGGLACLDRLMVEHPCPVVMVSSLTVEGAGATLEALRLGAVDFVAKPEGAVSLHLDELTAEIVGKVRQAANARIKASVRLRDRIRHRTNSIVNAPRISGSSIGTPLRPKRAVGDGVVLVGTSTGGPPALEALLAGLPASFTWPIVVAQHMPKAFTGPLAARLNKLCALSVLEVGGAAALRPGCAYIGRGDADIVVSRRDSVLIARSVVPQVNYPWQPSVDRLVSSAMGHVAPSQLVGILMTGMGNDGASAMAELHRRGGRTIAEAEETAVIWGMPGELATAGGADWILPLPQISDMLQRLVP